MILATGNVKLFSRKELRVATEDFFPGNKIGEGAFGSVYKVGILSCKMPVLSFLNIIYIIDIGFCREHFFIFLLLLFFWFV